ncbi:hypothetical protein cypCar_00018647 [Cyprinus carpio]|nr:hypothetical protein cypCar_00018647 [Cyprinus carpio]
MRVKAAIQLSKAPSIMKALLKHIQSIKVWFWTAPVCIFQNTVNVSLFSFLLFCLSADPLVGSIATQYLTNRAEHDRIARQWTKRYAT